MLQMINVMLLMVLQLCPVDMETSRKKRGRKCKNAQEMCLQKLARSAF